MRNLLPPFAAVLVVAAASPAISADMAVKAPPPAVVAVYSWGGFYAGVNAGGVWTKDDVTWISNPAVFGVAFSSTVNTGGTGSTNRAGATAGGQIGYNFQTNGPLLWGLEADINYTDLAGSRTVVLPAPAVPGTFVTSSFSSKWLATVRGRVGFLPTPNLLLYLTGGAAFAEVKTGDFAFFAADGSNNTASNSKTKSGWTVGGGAEWALSAGWSVKAEYLYVDLGNVNYTSLNTLTAFATINHNHRVTENIARVGVNYHFGGAPVIAKY